MTVAAVRKPVAERGPTPDWLLRGEVGLCPCGCLGKRKKGSFVEKTLRSSADLLRQAMFSEDVAGRPGLLQSIDARVKLVGTVVVLVTTALVHNLVLLAVIYAATLCGAAVSRLSVAFFVKRVWLFIPVFTGIVMLPATLSLVTPGDVVVPLWHWHGHPGGFTAQGLQAAAFVIGRVACSVSLVVLLTLTTPWPRLLAALRAVAVPRMFVLVLGMTYRYIFHLLSTVTDMYEARKARTVRTVRHDRHARRFLGASAGALIGKSLTLSEEVHQAMVARGFRGEARTLQQFVLRARDLVFAAAIVGCAVAVLGGDLFLGR